MHNRRQGVSMIGPQTTIPDIVLNLSEWEPRLAEEPINHPDGVHVANHPYMISVPCGSCEEELKLVVRGTRMDVRLLNFLLGGTLQLLCPSCVLDHGYYGQ